MKHTESIPTKITTLQELTNALLEAETSDFHSILRAMTLDKNELDEVSFWSDESYTRNCIVENESFELILLCWEEGQVTPIHDHGGEECWVYSVDGKFKETLFNPNEDGTFVNSDERYLNPGDITYMIDFMGFHNIENVTGRKSCSLHLYAKPIRECKIYNPDTSELTIKELSYDTTAEVMSNN